MSSAAPSPRPILVAVAWPYANGELHLGHIAGAYLPADIFARYHRMRGDRVLMVSGSDQHGTPVTVAADNEGVSPEQIVERFHPRFRALWDALGISFDLFTSTGTKNHQDAVHDMFLRWQERGFVFKATSQQFFDPQANRFLPDRYVEGTCPHCGYANARGDQCENCGRTLDPEQLLNPRSRLTGAVPEMRETEHFFFRLSAFQEPLLEWLRSRTGWRKHVQNFSIGFVEEGLHDRAITRDLDWGVSVPVEDLGPGKRIYVWIEALIGYLSASKEWAESSGDAEAWRAWWEDPNALTYYFIGKDNIPFHTIIWPSMLMAYGGLNLPTDVPANQYVTFKGAKASKSQAVGDSVSSYLERYDADALRYALAANLPENADTDMTEAEIIRRNNEELVATWGNLVNRVLAMIHRNFEGRVPGPSALDHRDEELLEGARTLVHQVGELIEAVHLKAALTHAMSFAQDANAYLSEREPWKTAKTDVGRTGSSLYVALCAITALNVALTPFLPATASRLRGYLAEQGDAVWSAARPEPGRQLPPAQPLFRKIETPEGEARLSA